MKVYEVFTALHPRLSHEEVASFASQLEEKIANLGTFSVTKRDIRHDQPLSYPIAHQLRAHTVVMEAQTNDKDEVLPNELNDEMRIRDGVLRYLTFLRPLTAIKASATGAPSVIDEMRSAQTTRGERTSHAPRVQTRTPTETSKEAMDTEAVDKKIEELLS
jgi:ribosomal protein S6